MSETNFPRTLQQAILYFADEDNCVEFVAMLRWPNGAVCPNCNKSEPAYYLPKYRRWNCKDCRKQFSVKVGTIFEESPIPLNKWVVAVWLIAAAKNGISSYEIHRSLGVTQKSAWFMSHRIRLALHNGSFEKMSGEVEVDETYIGGKARNMHHDKRVAKFGHGAMTGGAGKIAVFGLLERHGEGRTRVRAKAVIKHDATALQAEIRANVEPGSTVYTDEYGSYKTLGENGDFFHQFIRHAETYVDGAVHTNGIENFWSLLKRGIKGTYVSVEPFHMFRYLDEQTFRFNERFGDDADRFLTAMHGIVGKRLTYRKLTGKEQAEQV